MRNKYFALSSLATVVMASVLSLPVLGQNVSKTLSLTREANVGDQVLPAGKYNIKFDGEKDGELIISKGDREVAKVPYKLNQLEKEIADSVVVFSSGDGGKLHVSRIELKGMRAALQIQQSGLESR